MPLLQPDVVGQPFADLLHEEDRELLQPFLDMSEPIWKTSSHVQQMFVVRMKTTMSSTVRSQAKVQYKVGACTCDTVCVCVCACACVCACVCVCVCVCMCVCVCVAVLLVYLTSYPPPPSPLPPHNIHCRM